MAEPNAIVVTSEMHQYSKERICELIDKYPLENSCLLEDGKPNYKDVESSFAKLWQHMCNHITEIAIASKYTMEAFKEQDQMLSILKELLEYTETEDTYTFVHNGKEYTFSKC